MKVYNTYDENYLVTSVTDETGGQVLFTYDDYGRLIEEKLGDGSETITYSYDDTGGITITDAFGASITQYTNELGQITRIIDSLGSVSHFDYDGTGNLTQVRAADGTTSSFTYDSYGNVLTQIDSLGQTTEFTYDYTFNQLATLTDARGNQLSYDYDDKGNLLSITYADGSAETFGYDDNGNLTQGVNRRGQTVSYTYDSRFQLIEETEADGSTVSYTYDERGNLTSVTDATGTISFSYDDSDGLTQVSYPNGRSLSYSYDAVGRRTQMVDQDGNTVNYLYDGMGRLTGLTDGDEQTIVSYTYDAVGRLSEESKGNGTYTTYTYDANSRITNLVHYGADDTVNARFDYTYDVEGQIIGVDTLDGSWNYTYDAKNQLIDAQFISTNSDIADQSLSYVYDAVGNRIRTIINGENTNYNSNDINQYTSSGTIIYDYDADGNLISKVDGDDTWSYDYDANNVLVSVTEPDGSLTEYEYDALGNRIATVYNGVRTEYLVDVFGLGDVVGEYDGEGNLIANYSHGIGLESRTDASDNVGYYDFNTIGSTVGLTGSAGTYLNQYNYLPFGENLWESETVNNAFEYVGQWGVMEEENGLHFMQARYYDGEMGRFTALDPIGLNGGDSNLYRYAYNAPLSFVDPSGYANATYIISPPQLIVTSDDGQNTITIDGSDVFSGNGIHKNNPESVGIEDKGPVVPGEYILEDYFNENYNATWFYLDPGLLGKLAREFGVGRGGFNLHYGGDSAGCITVSNKNKWENLKQLLLADAKKGIANRITVISCPLELEITPPELPSILEDETSTNIIASKDPNDIVGPAGFGEENWINASDPLSYMIRFENQASATAPAQEVTISHPLDPDLDWRTFRLGNFGWGDYLFEIPENRAFYQERIDLTETEGFIVDLVARVDIQEGTAYWTLTTIDPNTGLPPEDATVGFLPPDNENGDGDGFVTYTIVPNNEVTTGTIIDAEATIVFDTEEPIDTPHIFNTLDLDSPTSSITPLPTTVGSKRFLVEWSGRDDQGGSGIAHYDIYVSENGGDFTLWLDDTPLTEAIYTGSLNSSYGFHSIAADNAGNIQPIPETAHTETTIDSRDNELPVISINEGLQIDEGTIKAIASTDLQVTDIDNSPTQLTYTLIDSPHNGQLLRDGIELFIDRTFTQDDIDNDLLSYQHDGSETISDNFSFTVADGDGGTIYTTAFNFTINPVNDPPEAIDDTATTYENIPLTLYGDILLTNDIDVDSDSFTLTEVDNPTNGQVLLDNNDNIVFTPEANFIGEATFDYTMSDDYGETDSATVHIDVKVRTPIPGTTEVDDLVGTSDSDIITGGLAADNLTGNGGSDTFVYQTFRDRGDTITDFEVTDDFLDLSQIFDGSGYGSTSPFNDYVRLGQLGANTQIEINPVGDRRDIFRPLVTLENVTATELTSNNFIL